MNNMNSGYCGWSMSNRAVEAYENGEMPMSKWTKQVILEVLAKTAEEYELDFTEDQMNFFSKMTKVELVDTFIKYSSWHHTGKYCNITNFYEFDSDELEYTFNDWDKFVEKIERHMKYDKIARKLAKNGCKPYQIAERVSDYFLYNKSIFLDLNVNFYLLVRYGESLAKK